MLKTLETNYYKFQNNSNKYACSYRMNYLETPIIVYNNNLILNINNVRQNAFNTIEQQMS